MKIISIVTAFPRNKNDVLIPWIIKLVHLLEKKDIKTDVFTSTYCGRKSEEYDGIKVTRFRYFFKKLEKMTHDMMVLDKIRSNKMWLFVLPFFMFFGSLNAFIYACRNRFDVIHVHWPFPLAFFGIAMKLRRNVPLVYTFHGASLILAKKNRIFRTVLKVLLRFPDLVTVNSSFTASLVREFSSKVKIEIIPFGSSVDSAFKLVENQTKKEVSVKDEKRKKVLFAGRLVERKGVEYLIKAAAILKEKRSDFTVEIVGDGPLFKDLNKLNEELETCDCVKFRGFVSDEELDTAYKTSYIFVLPAIYDRNGDTEGLGVVLVEAVQRNIALIASNVGGIVDIVKNEETGLLVPEKDEKALAEAIERILDDDKLYTKIVSEASKHIDSYFSWDRISKKYEEIYKDL